MFVYLKNFLCKYRQQTLSTNGNHVFLENIMKKNIYGELNIHRQIRDEITLLSEDMIINYPLIALDVLGYYSKFKIGIGLGWHYLLDLIWTLKKLSPYGKHLRILDAGGSLGILQFILACQGHSVVSVDAFYRDAPEECLGVIPIHISGNKESVETDYVKRVPETYKADNDILPRCTPGCGEIEFHCADLGNMPFIESNEFDAVVGISSLEHNSREQLAPILAEIRRVAKPSAPFIFTLSTSYDGSGFHEPSHSWLYDEQELREIYGLAANTISNFSHKAEYLVLLQNPVFMKKYLAAFYYRSEKSGMPNGIWNPPYLPFGLFHLNRK